MPPTSHHVTSGDGFITSKPTNNSSCSRRMLVRCKLHCDGWDITVGPLTEYSLRRWPMLSRISKRIIPCASQARLRSRSGAHCICLERPGREICNLPLETAESDGRSLITHYT